MTGSQHSPAPPIMPCCRALLPAGPDNMNMQDGVRFLLVQAMDDLVTSGRPDRIHDLSAAMLDDPDRREQIRRWLAWRR